MATDDDAEKIADLFNTIFLLRVNWLNSDNAAELPLEDLVEFLKLAKLLAANFQDDQTSNALWILTQSKGSIYSVLEDREAMRRLIITDDERRKILDATEDKKKFFTVSHLSRYDSVSPPASPEDHIDAMLADFLDAEVEVLRKSGLNQSSIAIIIETIRLHYPTVRKHILERRSVHAGKFHESIAALERMADRLSVFSDNTQSRIRQAARFANDLMSAKSKIIGLATLWGDAVPLILCRDWGIASVLSTTAGATISASFPQANV